jgi:hypothetical protein
MLISLFVFSGKRPGPSFIAASEYSPIQGRLFMTDARTKEQFLIDTGADLCVYPRRRIKGPRFKTSYELSAANGSRIATYGFVTLNLDFGLRRVFVWNFVIADVDRPIIGADFLSFYGLIVDINTRRTGVSRYLEGRLGVI